MTASCTYVERTNDYPDPDPEPGQVHVATVCGREAGQGLVCGYCGRPVARCEDHGGLMAAFTAMSTHMDLHRSSERSPKP